VEEKDDVDLAQTGQFFQSSKYRRIRAKWLPVSRLIPTVRTAPYLSSLPKLVSQRAAKPTLSSSCNSRVALRMHVFVAMLRSSLFVKHMAGGQLVGTKLPLKYFGGTV
jgi:hypothetical protein